MRPNPVVGAFPLGPLPLHRRQVRPHLRAFVELSPAGGMHVFDPTVHLWRVRRAGSPLLAGHLELGTELAAAIDLNRLHWDGDFWSTRSRKRAAHVAVARGCSSLTR